MGVALPLPALLALRTVYEEPSPKYLGYVNEGNLKGHLQYAFPVATPPAKFAVEPAKAVGSALVHIRSCDNNRYWVRSSAREDWIVAGAKERVEDQLAWNCTLFRPQIVDYQNKKVLQFVHVQLGQTVGMVNDAGSAHRFCLRAMPTPPPPKVDVALSTVVDYDSLMILPKHVAFLGCNDRYLAAKVVEGHNYLEFSQPDVGTEWVTQEAFNTEDGDLRFKNTYFGRFWRRSPNWIWADSTDTSDSDKDTLFRGVKVDDTNVVALRNLGNNLFCKGLTKEGKIDCLNADSVNIDDWARLKVVEPVLLRSIHAIEYHLDNARIYGRTPLIMGVQHASNNSSTTTTSTLRFRYTESTSTTWSNSQSLKLGVKATFTCGVPVVGNVGVEVSVESTFQWGWNETSTTSKEMVSAYTVSVPPRTRAKITLVATQGKCDVPFSYTQTDRLTNGDSVKLNLSDGVFSGVNAYHFDYHNEEEPLPRELWADN